MSQCWRISCGSEAQPQISSPTRITALQDEARSAHHSAESATAGHKEAARQLQRAQEVATAAKAQAEDMKARAKDEGQRADAAEHKRKAAVSEKEDLANRLALLGRDLQLGADHEHSANEVTSPLCATCSRRNEFARVDSDAGSER